MKVKKGDAVIVTSGKDKGRKGKIDRVLPAKSAVMLPGINMYKRHQKRKDDKHPGGIIEFPRPVPVANIAIVCPACHKPTRIGYLVTKNEKIRICRKCQQKV